MMRWVESAVSAYQAGTCSASWRGTVRYHSIPHPRLVVLVAGYRADATRLNGLMWRELAEKINAFYREY